MTIRKKNKFKWALIITSFVLSVIMFAAAVIGFFAPAENEHKLDRFDFKYGTVDNLNEVNSRKSIISKKSYNYKNIDIDILDSSVEVYLIIYEMGYSQMYRLMKGESVQTKLETAFASNSALDLSKVRILLKSSQIDGEYPDLNFFNIGKIFDGVTIKAF